MSDLVFDMKYGLADVSDIEWNPTNHDIRSFLDILKPDEKLAITGEPGNRHLDIMTFNDEDTEYTVLYRISDKRAYELQRDFRICSNFPIETPSFAVKIARVKLKIPSIYA